MKKEEEVNSEGQTRSVARTACLNCRAAKRKCDGKQPVCGQCAGRGIQDGGCNFVSSKRGGPRFKGVKGSDNALIKAQRDKLRDAQRIHKFARADGEQHRSTLKRPRGQAVKAESESSQANSSTSNDNTGELAGGSNSSSISLTPATDQSLWHRQSYNSSTNSEQFVGNNGKSNSNGFLSSSIPPQGQASYNHVTNNFDSLASENALYYTENYHHELTHQQQLAAAAAAAAMSNSSLLFGDPANALPDQNNVNLGLGDALSFENLELLQRSQERSDPQHVQTQMSDFFSRLQFLPKAGTSRLDVDHTNPLDVMLEWEGGEVGGNLQESENGVRTLLSDFYELVYPCCPVLPSPGNLPSLAFYFSGKGPCGLFAALSAVVALHLPPDEAHKTLKASQHPLQKYEGNFSCSFPATRNGPERSNIDVAAYHAKASEFIIHQWEESNRTCFLDTTAHNHYGGLDEELITIEAGAAHTLLCMYYYGTGQPLAYQRAYKHAVEGWNLLQKLDVPAKASWDSWGEGKPGQFQPFSSQIKLEWAKRVYWCAYTAATVLSCVGGFEPFGNPMNMVMSLQLRPSLDDVSAWGVMVRGAQQVSQTYRLLYELDNLRRRLIESGHAMGHDELQEVTTRRQTIFNAMLKLDTEISNYTRFDAGWRDLPPGPGEEGFKTADKELARSLKASGRLMTSGALILLHRAQAFSNTRLFIEPQCGIPERSRRPSNQLSSTLSIMHHTDSPGGLDHEQQHMTQPSPLRNGLDLQMHGAGAKIGQPMAAAAAAGRRAPHPFLTDRFSAGPFEPSHSLGRCRFAASTMVGTLPRLLQDPSPVPKLPPYNACSYVLGAYAILMMTLLIQARSELASTAVGVDGGGTEDQQWYNDPAEVQRQIELHRAPVRDIILALKKFGAFWPKALEYENEVSTLLAANEILG